MSSEREGRVLLAAFTLTSVVRCIFPKANLSIRVMSITGSAFELLLIIFLLLHHMTLNSLFFGVDRPPRSSQRGGTSRYVAVSSRFMSS